MAIALMLGGGGLVAVNVYASATEGLGSSGGSPNGVLAAGAATIDCPDVGSQLTQVPDGAREEVDRDLAVLDKQTAEAYQRLQDSARAIQQDIDFADDSIMNPLKNKRAATIERILIAIDRVGDRPQGLEEFAPCTLRASGNQNVGGEQNGGQGGDGQNDGDQADAGQNGGQAGDGQNGGGQDQGGQNQNQGGDENQGGDQGNGGQAGNGPVAADFVDIKSVQPNVQAPPRSGNASGGSFTTSCGVNAGGLFNSDNVIVAPGVSNGAHHFHDYVGNQGNDAFASDEDLAAAETSCEGKGDKSSYFWPVLRLQNGKQEQDANAPGGGIEGNAGEIVTPKKVTMQFVGSPKGDVVAMPRLLRIITGDAKAFVNGPGNANASWSCTGFEDRQLKDKYPLCPRGSDVVRTFKFQSCWDGRNSDSANHRTHVAFAAADGSCAGGFQVIPQLVQRIVYDVDAPSLQDGGRTTPLFAVDSFPEQLHKPVTDHGDFINVFDEDLMKRMVQCINDGKRCDAADGAGGNNDGGQDDGGNADGNAGGGQDDGQDQDNGQDTGNGGGKGGTGDQGDKDDTGDTGGDQATEEPQVLASPSATQRDKGGSGAKDDVQTGVGGVADATPGPEPTENTIVANGGSGSQGSDGSLAETGTQLWPAAAGALLLIGGFVLLRRVRRGSY